MRDFSLKNILGFSTSRPPLQQGGCATLLHMFPPAILHATRRCERRGAPTTEAGVANLSCPHLCEAPVRDVELGQRAAEIRDGGQNACARPVCYRQAGRARWNVNAPLSAAKAGAFGHRRSTSKIEC